MKRIMKNRFTCILTAAIVLISVIYVPASVTTYAITSAESADISEPVEKNQSSDESSGTEDKVYNITDAEVSIPHESYEYTGESILPEVVVKLNDAVLVENRDYTLIVRDNINVGTATVVVNGIGEYEGTICKNFGIIKADISKAVVNTVRNYKSFAFNKKAIKPEITVSLENKKLTAGTDYSISYKNNIYPGTGVITVTGKGNYKGSVEKKFFISRVLHVKVKENGTDSQTISWGKASYVTGYKLYTYDTKNNKWKLVKTIKGNKNTSYEVKKLKYATGYKYAVRAYYKKGVKTYYGAYSETLIAPTKPYKSKITGISQSALLKMKVKWEKRRGSGYQIKVATNSAFKNATTYTVKDNATLSKTVSSLKDQKKYYVKVRAYVSYESKTVYGSWSSVKETKASDTGWASTGGKLYYYVNGKVVKGNKTISGSKYYFDNTTGQLLGATATMWNKVKNKTSGTEYLIAVSRSMNRVVVYKGSAGNWSAQKYWKCSTGAKGTATPAGSFSTPIKRAKLGYIGGHITYTCWYATRITNRIFFHSVLYNPRSKTSIQDGRLGYNISHGCIRLSLNNAKWLYNNIKPNTRVIIY